MLTALQERILRIVADLPEAGGFALAGGAALIVHGVVERQTEEEGAADKTLALFGRAEPRDFVDVFHLAKRFGFDRLCGLASAKDTGFSRERLAETLGRFEHIEQKRFDVDEAAFDAIARWVRSLRAELTAPPRGADPPGLSL